MIKVLIKKLNPKVQLPKYKTIGSSGMDLMALIENPIIIEPQKSALIPTGLSIAIPEDTEVQIRPRSGLAVKSSISVLNTPGTIDSDYRGPISIMIWNITNKSVIIEAGTRIAQGVLCPVIRANFEEEESLEDTDRGSGGFGSTGLKWLVL